MAIWIRNPYFIPNSFNIFSVTQAINTNVLEIKPKKYPFSKMFTTFSRRRVI